MFTVTNPSDAVVNTPAAVGMLRQAVFDANQSPDPDTIEFASNLNGSSILLTQGQLFISESVTIDASMLGSITIDASESDASPAAGDGIRVFSIVGSPVFDVSVSLKGLTLTGGDPAGGSGGAIRSNYASLELRDCVITGNQTLGNGGAVSFGHEELKLYSTTIRDNHAGVTGNSANGGGVYADTDEPIRIDQSTIESNTTSGYNSLGGGAYLKSKTPRFLETAAVWMAGEFSFVTETY